MEYKISRYEKNKDNDGVVKSIFLSVVVSNEIKSSYYEYWLTPEEIEMVIANESNLMPIIVKCYAEAELKLENEILNSPPILTSDNEKELLENMINLEDVIEKKKLLEKIKEENE